MNANKPASRHSLKSGPARIDAYQVQPGEYEKLPEPTEDMPARASVG